MKKCLTVIGFLLLVAALAVVAIALLMPWMNRWGATGEELVQSLPGDEIVAGASVETTRAIEIGSPAARVWPWLAQIGQGRGGWYSYDWLENLLGCDIHTLDHIEPALQTLQVGDEIRLGPQEGLPSYKVVLMEPGQALVLRSVNPQTGAEGETWGFYLLEKQSGLTRLVVRHRATPGIDATERIFNTVFQPISFVMERRMLKGIRERAEMN
jgi:hypothetical protein